ncbi:hypothetical protein E5720_12985 [Rhodococcus sp. PAMC28707]|uniref:hypothetical protein n=1 Tax=unclassified Rhodococcus (in: high G+C Gram-positive bacteria) TaxID=192944 RepID=UPI00109E0CE3|nr:MULTISPECIES: hypothetical protein [unclassified Rhodococcus (in: high G+C Gram-positive bacteria)]QCB49041.1 hypothetical protein E5769_01030 [Rhodococcus sp. PAMC28705]QCB59271.1 hypothetical protein E5720_12985 [Rhodococcus sp. PAMC28707]
MNRKPLLWALAAASVLGLTFLSAQETGATWRSAQAVSGGTITSGRLELAVGNSGVQSKSLDFAAFGGGNRILGPGDYSQAPLTVFNKGNIPMRYRIQNTIQSSATMPLRLDVSSVVSEAACPAPPAAKIGVGALYSGPMIGAAFPAAGQWRRLSPGASEVLCMTGTVGINPPSGAQSTVTFSVAAKQD